jgi:hypothetical protein
MWSPLPLCRCLCTRIHTAGLAFSHPDNNVNQNSDDENNDKDAGIKAGSKNIPDQFTTCHREEHEHYANVN